MNDYEFMFQTSLNNKVNLRTKARIGTDPTGSVTITENGEHNVKDYAATVVNVPQTEESPLAVTPTKSEQVFEAEELHAYNPVTVHAIPPEYIIPTGQKTITENGTHDVSQYDTAAVNVLPVMQEKTVTPQKTAQTAEPDAGKDGLSRVYVAAIPEYFRRMPELSSKNRTAQWFNAAAIGSTQAIRLLNADEAPEIGEAITIQPTITGYNEGQNAGACITGTVTSVDTTNGVLVTITVTDKYIDLIPNGTLNVTSNGTYNTKGKEAVNVTVRPTLQDKTATPTETTQQITADSGYDGLNQVTVQPIPSEYIIPTGTIQIDSAGTFDVSEYAEAEVTASGGPQEVLTNPATDPDAPTELHVTGLVDVRPYALYTQSSIQFLDLPDADKLGAFACSEMTNLQQALLLSATYLGQGVFKGDGALLEVVAPNVTLISRETFSTCALLEEINLPSLTEIAQPTQTFAYCTHLKKLRLQSFQSLRANASNLFQGTTALESIDSGVATAINSPTTLAGLNVCTALKLVILRNTSQVAALSTAFNSNAPITRGSGFVLVPRALIAQYRAATNWAALATAGTQFLAVEDYTADGTTTGKLDEDAIDALLA